MQTHLAAVANQRLIEATVKYAKEATRFDGLALPEDEKRMLNLLKLERMIKRGGRPVRA